MERGSYVEENSRQIESKCKGPIVRVCLGCLIKEQQGIYCCWRNFSKGEEESGYQDRQVARSSIV